MLLLTTRILLLALLILLSFFIMKRTRVAGNKLCVFAVVIVCVLLASATSIFPPENAFITFRSPEAVCKYTAIGDVEAVVEGEGSACVIYRVNSHEFSSCIVPKNSNGYKIPTYFYKEKIAHTFNTFGVYTTVRAKNSNDYYIFATLPSESQELLQVFDAAGQCVETNGALYGTAFQCICLQNFSSEYYLIINGEKIELG